MSRVVAVDASGHDVLDRIETTILPCMKVLCGAPEPFRVTMFNLAGSAEGFEIVLPHR